MFDQISFSEKSTVRLLLTYRWKYDELFVERMMKGNCLSISDIKLNENIIVIYVSLDNLIEKCKFSKYTNYVLNKIMQGYEPTEIGDEKEINSLLTKSINRIIKINNMDYQDKDEICEHVKIPNDVKYKRCKVCNRDLKINTQNFQINQEGLFHAKCLLCQDNI